MQLRAAVHERHLRLADEDRTACGLALARLCREAEVDDVAVLHDVFLALEPHLAVVAARGHRSARDQRVVADDLRADEPARDVAVDLAGRELRRRAARDRPRAALVFADREERNVAEQIVAGADDAIEPGFGESQIGEERRGVGGVELRDFELDLRAERRPPRSRPARETPSARSRPRALRASPPAARLALRRG